MKNLKITLLLATITFVSFSGFSQSEECVQKMAPMMKQLEKKMSSDPNMTQAKAEALTNDFIAAATKEFPECFSDSFEKERTAQEQKAIQEVQAEKEKQKRIRKQQTAKEKERKKVAVKKESIPKPKALKTLEKKRKATNKSDSRYKAFRKECMVEMQLTIKELREKSLKYLEEAGNPAEEKEVRAAFQKAKSRILHDCAILKMESK